MIDFKKIEAETLKFWEDEKIYEKVKNKNKNGKKFYFLQGPPYTSGKIHIGQAWNNSMKDIILRYKRMKGLNVWDRAGYDMHGLPTENAVQKKLGLKNKEEIGDYGVDKFVKECLAFSKEYAGYMSRDLWKLGVWIDYENAYMPIKKDWIGGEWAFFKKAWEQKRLYRGKKVMHWDAETETSLAKHELEYETIKDTSVFLKFAKIMSK
jgi:isoleucyl-tRNA synthetase